jgi:hypothetical protein
MTCTDDVGNSVSTYRLFEPRASAFEFIRAYASSQWIYQGQSVNITLELAANNTWSSIADIIYINSSASGDSLDIGDFSPEINASRKITYLNNAAITTTAIGKYNLTIVSLYTNDGISISPMPVIVENIFEVFEAVNQTLNVN